MTDYDVLIVGGGIYGCSIAKHLAEDTALTVCVLEREHHLGAHQSGRNSGTLHAGLVLDAEPDSRESVYGREGSRLLKQYCEENGLPINDCGMLVVARTDREEARLRDVRERMRATDLEIEYLETESEIRSIEPNVRGTAALYTPESGTLDSQWIVHQLAVDAMREGADFQLDCEVEAVRSEPDGIRVESAIGTVTGDYLVNAAGAWSLQVAQSMGIAQQFEMIPVRGDYYELTFGRRDLVRTNVYPVGSPELDGFVGVHFSRKPSGKVLVGPAGRLASGFESYERRDVDVTKLLGTLTSKQFRRFMGSPRKWRMAWRELNRSFRRSEFLRACRYLVPSIEDDDLGRSFTGIGGYLIDEQGRERAGFVTEQTDRSTHLLQVHPGMTAALSAGGAVARDVAKEIE